ncbi:MAG: hypothetical protein RMK80_09675 [Pseudobdellovibrionaceae bacterium]|nr:hypothetical protein [Pseudobdellovibrionaceae bacterium]
MSQAAIRHSLKPGDTVRCRSQYWRVVGVRPQHHPFVELEWIPVGPQRHGIPETVMAHTEIERIERFPPEDVFCPAPNGKQIRSKRNYKPFCESLNRKKKPFQKTEQWFNAPTGEQSKLSHGSLSLGDAFSKIFHFPDY